MVELLLFKKEVYLFIFILGCVGSWLLRIADFKECVEAKPCLSSPYQGVCEGDWRLPGPEGRERAPASVKYRLCHRQYRDFCANYIT